MFITKIYKKTNKELVGMLTVLIMSAAVCAISVRINVFRYNNFDFGKFDLGNMTQMVWNTLHGRPLYLTDYFGGNVPRWSMSHVDPILLLFVPLFAVIPHPLTLVFAQLFLTTVLAPLILFKIAKIYLKTNLAATLISLAYLLYPALGYLNTQTGFHGVSAAIPFLFLMFYFIEKKNYPGLWISAIITMAGKEQLALYTALLCVFGLVYKTSRISGARFFSTTWFKKYLSQPITKNLISLLLVSIVWFVVAFFIIIPEYAHYRIESYSQFTQELNIDTELTNDVIKSNYFLSRYQDLGDSYGQILLGMLTDPKRLVTIIFSGDKLDNFNKTFAPTAYLSFLAPQVLAAAVPDLIINYATTAGGIGTSEITNHRVSMIIPVVLLATVVAIDTLARYITLALNSINKNKKRVRIQTIALFLSAAVLTTSAVATFRYNNPVFLWLTQAVSKRIGSVAYAKFDREVSLKSDLTVGDIFKISGLENKDRECARMIVNSIPTNASVSGPDYLGAHLAQRETYAIFPALYSKADYVIVDVFSQKIMRILDSDVSLVRDVVGDMIVNTGYKNISSCGNLFVFKKSPQLNKSARLPIQEQYKYPVDLNMEIFQDLYLTDFELPKTVTREQTSNAKFVYVKKSNLTDEYVLFTSFINSETGEMYQSANIPSYGLNSIRNWTQDRFYIEQIELNIPTAVDPGTYRTFVGITNNSRTRSIYLGDIEVL